jgi:hypothetical protein
MVWYGGSNQTIPDAYIITGMVLPVRPIIPVRMPRLLRTRSKTYRRVKETVLYY